MVIRHSHRNCRSRYACAVDVAFFRRLSTSSNIVAAPRRLRGGQKRARRYEDARHKYSSGLAARSIS